MGWPEEDGGPEAAGGTPGAVLARTTKDFLKSEKKIELKHMILKP